MAAPPASESSAGTTLSKQVPQAYFVEDVAAFMVEKKKSAKELLADCDKTFTEYKSIESRLGQRLRKLQSQIVEIKSSLGMLEHLDGLAGDEAMQTDFRLNDALFVKATVSKTDKVALWLGANVMMEYDTTEALALLRTNFEKSKSQIELVKTDMDYIRDQITTMEVNMARIYNHDVMLTREAKGAAAKA